MADVKWIKIATDIFDNRKIAQIEAMPEGDAIIVIWIKLLCLAGSINDRGCIYLTQEIPYTEAMLATQFRRPLNTVNLAMKTFEAFGMIEIEDDILRVSNWERYQNVDGMEKIRAQTRERVQKHRDKKRLEALEDKGGENVTGCNVTGRYEVTFRNGIEVEVEEEQNQITTTTTSTTELVFRLADGTEYTPEAEKVDEWTKAFVAIDVPAALKMCAAKHNASARRKNAVTIDQYIVNWLIVESGNVKKAAKERRRNGFSDMPEHGDEITVAELRGRNGNLI